MPFDPNSKPESGPDVTAGPQLLVMRANKFKVSESGTRYQSVKLRVIHGPDKGGEFWTMLSTDTSKQGNHVRWRALCEYAGVTSVFEPEDNDDVARLFHGVPFKADVEVKQNGRFTNHNLSRIVFKRSLADWEVEAIERWHLEQATGEDEPPPHSDQDSYGSAKNPGDDQIPF